jgi:hypothetical protein
LNFANYCGNLTRKLLDFVSNAASHRRRSAQEHGACLIQYHMRFLSQSQGYKVTDLWKAFVATGQIEAYNHLAVKSVHQLSREDFP